jgi:uncharacterized surface protein with fasciclin (FAS1) repeats
MKLKNLAIASTAALACTFGAANAKAEASSALAECLSTPMVNFDGTVVDAALATPELSTLVDAVVAAGLVDALNDAENITVYAPTNDAFAAIPPDVTGALLADTAALTSVLTYHVTPSLDDPRRYVPPVRRGTLQGDVVFYQRMNSMPMVNNAAVSCTGVMTTNGYVWIIDSVLFPNF